MAVVERITVTLSQDLVTGIDRLEKNRSRFVAEAVRNELERRQRAGLRRSLENPRGESVEGEELGFDEWSQGLREEDTSGLVDMRAGKAIRWVPGEGWAGTGE